MKKFIILFAVFVFGCDQVEAAIRKHSEFSDSDIENIKSSVESRLNEECGKTTAVTVFKLNPCHTSEVSFIKESPRKLTGYAHIIDDYGNHWDKECYAIMSDDGKQSIIWQCK